MCIRTVIVPTLALLIVLSAGCGGGGGGGGSQPSDVPAGVEVTWRGGGDGVTGYVVHWGTVSGVYDSALDVGMPPMSVDGLVVVVIAVESAPIYYFAVTSYDGAAQASAYSNEVSVELQ